MTTTTQGLVERFYQVASYHTPTERQLSYLFDLAGDRVAESLGHDGEERIENLAAVIENERPDRHAVSRWINFLRAQPREQREQAPAASEPLTPGVYEVGGEVYVVKPNREGTHLYAKRLVEIGGSRLTETGEHVQVEFEYAPGAIRSIRPEHRMDVKRAKALTLRYGRCINCGRRLKAAKSVEQGIGPVCIKAFA